MDFNLADIFESLADAVPDNVALVSAPHRLTYRQLDERSNQFAHALLDSGVKAGEHVGLFLYNGAEFIEAMIGCFKIRAVPININYRYVEDELAYLLDNADIVAVVYQRELESRVVNVKDKTKTVRLTVVVEDGSPVVASPAAQWNDFVGGRKTTRGFAPRSPDDQYIIYTGGTTGMPRGVMWRQEDVFFAGLQGGNPGGPALEKADDVAALAPGRDLPMVILPAAPFIHGAAQWAAWIAFLTGGKVVLSPGKSFDPTNAVKLIEQEEVQVLNLVGDAMARPLTDAIRAAKKELPSLMVISSAGAILSSSVKTELAELCPNTMVLNSFGASETGHQGTIYPGMDAPGKLTFYMDETNTVLDDDGKPVVPGSGVIGKLARSGRIPIGYYKDAVKTAATFLHVEGVRWVVPGDLATIEEDGRISVFGRGAVCINSGGEKVFPEEVEEALKAHPQIVDAVVVGVPDERWGQRVTAVVQCGPGVSLTLADVDAHCRTKVAGYKVPREVHLVSTISRHPSGKPDYRWAKDVATGQLKA